MAKNSHKASRTKIVPVTSKKSKEKAAAIATKRRLLGLRVKQKAVIVAGNANPESKLISRVRGWEGSEGILFWDGNEGRMDVLITKNVRLPIGHGVTTVYIKGTKYRGFSVAELVGEWEVNKYLNDHFRILKGQ